MDGSQSLTFTAQFRREAELLVAEVEGRIEDTAALGALFLAVAKHMREGAHTRVLILDNTFGVVPPEADMRALFSQLRGKGFEDVRIAYVDARGTAVARMEIGEIIAREQGYDCRVFDNEPRARIWLHYGET